MHRSRLVALLAALALLAPASAFAQSAGDNQYQDPFGGGNGGGQSSGGGSSSSGGSGTTTTQAPAPAPTAAPAPAPVAQAAQQTTTAAPQLPRTGHDPITPAVAGFWLLLGGVTLRARLRQR